MISLEKQFETTCVSCFCPMFFVSPGKDAKARFVSPSIQAKSFQPWVLGTIFAFGMPRALLFQPMKHLCRWSVASCWCLKSTFQLKSTSLMVQTLFLRRAIHRFAGDIPWPVDVPFERLVPRRWEEGLEMKPASWGHGYTNVFFDSKSSDVPSCKLT